MSHNSFVIFVLVINYVFEWFCHFSFLHSNEDQDQPANTGEEIEFSVSSVSAAAGEASENLPLADFIRHPRTD